MVYNGHPDHLSLARRARLRYGGAVRHGHLCRISRSAGLQQTRALLPLALKQTVALFTFEIAQQANEVVLCLRQPGTAR
jgi:hypothetical protein